MAQSQGETPRRRRLLVALVLCTVVDAEIKGINYGGRFIPEHWLGLPHMRELYVGAMPGGDCSPQPCKLSLCDVAMAAPTEGDAGQRMMRYLNRSIQLEHFETIKRMGFDFVRLPLGYWNLVRPMEAPDAPNGTASRWRALELMATPSDYAPFIARVLSFANSTGLQVLLDLHGAPGGQTVNQDTGCATGCEGDGCGEASHYFTRPRNVATAVAAVTRLAQLCAAAGPTCYGVELLNEPSPHVAGEGASDRAALLKYYKHAIAAARGAGGLDAAVPIVLMDWPQFLATYWLLNARALEALPGAGTLVWESHIYAPLTTSTLLELKAVTLPLFELLRGFAAASGAKVMLGEWTLARLSSGDTIDAAAARYYYEETSDDPFLGRCVWNFDGPGAWGAIQPNNASEHNFWPAVNHPAALVESRAF